jgi:transmembrane sensor
MPWRVLAQDGQFDQAYRSLETSNLAAASDEPGDLLLLADIARLSHHPAESIAPLEKLLREHRSDPRAALCAFTLGRVLLDDLGKPREAAAAFREAQLLDPSFAMIEEALAREVKALWRAGDSTAAHERALEYLRRFPEGGSARSVRRFGALD